MTAPHSAVETRNESYRFLHRTTVAKKRIKERENARKGDKPQASTDAEQMLSRAREAAKGFALGVIPGARINPPRSPTNQTQTYTYL